MKNPRKIQGNFGATFGTKTKKKLRELLFCNFADLTGFGAGSEWHSSPQICRKEGKPGKRHFNYLHQLWYAPNPGSKEIWFLTEGLKRAKIASILFLAKCIGTTTVLFPRKKKRLLESGQACEHDLQLFNVDGLTIKPSNPQTLNKEEKSIHHHPGDPPFFYFRV